MPSTILRSRSQALAAVALFFTADPAPCDVDGNGAVSVTDGVNVLRAAAGLTVDFQCFDLE